MLLWKEPQKEKEEPCADVLGENNQSNVKKGLCLGSLDPSSWLKKDHCFHHPGMICFKLSKKYFESLLYKPDFSQQRAHLLCSFLFFFFSLLPVRRSGNMLQMLDPKAQKHTLLAYLYTGMQFNNKNLKTVAINYRYTQKHRPISGTCLVK